MRFLVMTFAGLALLAPHAARIAHPDAALKATLVHRENQSWAAFKDGDAKFFEVFLADDYVVVGFGGRGTKKDLVASIKSGECTVKSYTLDGFELSRFSEKAALLTYHATQDISCHDTPLPTPVWASSLYVKRGDRWLQAFGQQTQAAQ